MTMCTGWSLCSTLLQDLYHPSAHMLLYRPTDADDAADGSGWTLQFCALIDRKQIYRRGQKTGARTHDHNSVNS